MDCLSSKENALKELSQRRLILANEAQPHLSRKAKVSSIIKMLKGSNREHSLTFLCKGKVALYGRSLFWIR